MTTQLEVLNHVIGIVGETSVSSVTSNHPTAQSALKTITRVSKQFQLRGWWFNKEYSLPLSPNDNGEVIVPSTTIKIRPTDSANAYIQRGSRLYDPVNHTYNIGAIVKVDVTLQLATEDLPEAAAMYLMHKSAYDFYMADDGDIEKGKALLFEVTTAWAALTAQQLQMSRTNALNRPVAACLRAGIHQTGGSFNPKYPGGGN